MTFTLEARWFGVPPLPEAVRNWFASLGSVDTTDQTDLYLPAEDTALNLKLRDGRFQIKRRLAGPSRTALTPDVTARCEQWVKWSFDLCDDAERPSASDDPTGLWVPVHKTRHQLSISPTDQSALSPELPTAPPAQIDLELTTIEALDDEAWTFCLEAVGDVSSLRDTFLTAAPALLADLPGALPADQSYGYSRWLHQHPAVTPHPASAITIPSSE